MCNTNLEWLDEATNMRKDDLYEKDDLWDDEDVDEDGDEDGDEEYCELCEKYDCEGECKDSGHDEEDDPDRCNYEEDPDEYWYGEDD